MNNEQREQQMMSAADRYAAEIYKDEPDNFHTDEQLCETINDFCAGWRAADQHPQMKPENKLQDFKKEVEGLHDIADAEEYARQLAHLFLGNGLSLQTILLMAIDFGQQHPQWIPVEDGLPTIPDNYICVEVLFRTKFGANHLGKYFGDKWISYEDYTCKTEDISYWMPLPQPPRKEED